MGGGSSKMTSEGEGTKGKLFNWLDFEGQVEFYIHCSKEWYSVLYFRTRDDSSKCGSLELRFFNIEVQTPLGIQKKSSGSSGENCHFGCHKRIQLLKAGILGTHELCCTEQVKFAMISDGTIMFGATAIILQTKLEQTFTKNLRPYLEREETNDVEVE